MKKMIEKTDRCTEIQPGCIKISDAPGLHLCLQNPNQCFWLYSTGRHYVTLGSYPTTSTDVAIKRASLAEFVSDSISPSHFLSQESTSRKLVALQQFVKAGNERGLIKCHDSVQLSDIIEQLKLTPIKSNPNLDYRMIPNIMAVLTQREDIVSSALEFSILTSARFRDVVRFKWEDLTIKAGHIRTSSGVRGQRFVPLSDSCQNLLSGLPINGEHIFSTTEGKPISVNQLQRTAQKFDPKFSSPKIRGALRTWMSLEAKEHQYKPKQEEFGHSHALENRQTPGLMTAWSNFCYSRV